MDIRSLYLDYFKSKGHIVYDSMPLVPDDASLLFTNAGMVQFKDIFTGKIPAPQTPRATSSQLCIRAGGKHNDLENVGYTARHHTLFEMLGNFSFGDYFKEQAIAYAWEFVTEVLKFDKSLLYVSVYESDDEAYEIWQKYIDSSRIKKMGEKDNFWQMGDTGPCGPCSEIYVDQGSKYFNSSEDYFGGEGDRFLEIWNLVFMQFEQKDGIRTPLPKPSIDTGMGLERVIALKEGKINNFDTSLFAPIMKEIERLTGLKYVHDDKLLDLSLNEKENLDSQKNINASFRVIADHVRSVAFLLAQGVNFDKEGRGYVLRRILRRAVRHGYLLGLKKAFLFEIVGVVCENFANAYPYLNERKSAIQKQCKLEEERFFETIESGMELFNTEFKKLQNSSKNNFSGEVAFRLYDTYGFPLDLTQDMLRNHNIEVDMNEFDKCMNEQKSRSKASWKGSGDLTINGDFNTLLDKFGENKFLGYEYTKLESKILSLLDSNYKITNCLNANEKGFVLLDSTPFYPESGGQIGDIGVLKNNENLVAKVVGTKKYFGLNLSEVEAVSTIKEQDKITAIVDSSRIETAKHHSATHLLHKALREVLGSHIAQAGSLVESNRLRFDFSHFGAMSEEEINKVENLVNEAINIASPQICENLNINEAKKKGAMALFGEKYGEVVRVISFGDSIELCGGIHTPNTANIGNFFIVKESGVSSGVRRIEAVCGKAGFNYAKNAIETIKEAKAALKAQDLMQGINKLKLQNTKTKQSQNTNTSNLESKNINGVHLIVAQIESDDLKILIDEVKNKFEKVAVLLINGAKIYAGVKGISGLKAGEWVKVTAMIMGGNGGGRDDFASAGGKDLSKINEALKKASEFAESKING